MHTNNAIDDFIDQRLDNSLLQLARLVGSPSVSSQNVGMEATAELVAEMLEAYGFETRLLPTPTYPVVYGEAPGRSDRTLLCYNHYDVQPPEPLELWESPPFEMSRREGKLYGRGIADDKGHIVSRLAALEATRDKQGLYPCRIKFLIEGGEEISSPHIPDLISEHRDLLAADACVWETGGVDYEGRPGLMLGMRGILYVQYTAKTMSRDAHSGSAHLLPNAVWRLVRALGHIKDENDRILIPGFYDNAYPITDADRVLLQRLESDEEATKRSYGIPSFIHDLTGEAAKEAVFSPTANIAGISGGYEGPGAKTVIPASAVAKMDFRLVPDQDPMQIYENLKQYVSNLGFADIEVEYLGGEKAAQTPADDPFVRLTAAAAEEVYGEAPRISPLIGGSGPMHPFREYLGVPIVTVGISYPESLVHAPNENITERNFILGTRHMAHLVSRFAGS